MDSARKFLITAFGIVLCFYTILFVNYSVLQPQSALALFIMIGMVLCFSGATGSANRIKHFRMLSLQASDPDKFNRQSRWWKIDIAIRWILANRNGDLFPLHFCPD